MTMDVDQEDQNSLLNDKPVKSFDKGIKNDRPKQIFNYRKRMIARNKEAIIKTSTTTIFED